MVTAFPISRPLPFRSLPLSPRPQNFENPPTGDFPHTTPRPRATSHHKTPRHSPQNPPTGDKCHDQSRPWAGFQNQVRRDIAADGRNPWRHSEIQPAKPKPRPRGSNRSPIHQTQATWIEPEPRASLRVQEPRAAVEYVELRSGIRKHSQCADGQSIRRCHTSNMKQVRGSHDDVPRRSGWLEPPPSEHAESGVALSAQ
ncbi:hypothetical protein KEM60_01058 [Austwickia sp. TVS 96-490-7B]|nr:hypothetical protein [Austwickia sp. TVS 96-490-7B]